MSVGLAPELQGEGQSHRFKIAPAAPSRSPLMRGVALSIVAATALALFLRLYQLSRPNYLLGVSGYDDGVDFGSALRLVNGSFPYRTLRSSSLRGSPCCWLRWRFWERSWAATRPLRSLAS